MMYYYGHKYTVANRAHDAIVISVMPHIVLFYLFRVERLHGLFFRTFSQTLAVDRCRAMVQNDERREKVRTDHFCTRSRRLACTGRHSLGRIHIYIYIYVAGSWLCFIT